MTRAVSKPLVVQKAKPSPSKGLLLYWRLARHEMAVLAPVPKVKGKSLLQFLRLAKVRHQDA